MGADRDAGDAVLAINVCRSTKLSALNEDVGTREWVAEVVHDAASELTGLSGSGEGAEQEEQENTHRRIVSRNSRGWYRRAQGTSKYRETPALHFVLVNTETRERFERFEEKDRALRCC